MRATILAAAVLVLAACADEGVPGGLPSELDRLASVEPTPTGPTCRPPSRLDALATRVLAGAPTVPASRPRRAAVMVRTSAPRLFPAPVPASPPAPDWMIGEAPRRRAPSTLDAAFEAVREVRTRGARVDLPGGSLGVRVTGGGAQVTLQGNF